MSTVNSTSFLTGLVVGGTVGALAALLCAPQEGVGFAACRKLRSKTDLDPRVDDESDQSFPASDPPSWTSATTGSTR